jgi:PPK2 family polyphosphate:nucleotide phosphotransferase
MAMEATMERYRVRKGDKINLSDWNPQGTEEFKGDKESAESATEALALQLGELQQRLFAEHKHKVLVIFQAMDTGGKDGVIKKVFREINPQGVTVASFKVPNAAEIEHDYLWRIHQRVPAKGELTIFNRSHYEDVLVVRVHELVSKEVWEKRYEHIRNFEHMLADEGTLILKFFLHISPDEQRQRLIDRIDDPQKNWKFNAGDLDERKLWPEYMHAFEDAISETSTDFAPWYIIPANHKWYRDYVVSKIIVEALKKLDMGYPKPAEDLEKYRALLT